MSALEHLGLLLALASLAGLNLYLTAFLFGVAARLEWFSGAEHAGLDAISSPAVLGVTLALFLVQFLIDKIPWADSLWDSIHSFLRPAGGALLAIASLAPGTSSAVQIGAAALGALAALLLHSTKAGLRLRINTSPEPLSNVAMSLVEDVLVVLGFALAEDKPALALAVFGAVLVGCLAVAPTLLRSTRGILWLVWRKLRVPAKKAGVTQENDGVALVDEDDRRALAAHLGGGKPQIRAAGPCLIGKRAGIPCKRNWRGLLVAAESSSSRGLYFIRRSSLRRRRRQVLGFDLDGSRAQRRPLFLSENLNLAGSEESWQIEFLFPRGSAHLVDRLHTAVGTMQSPAHDPNAGRRDMAEPDEPAAP